MRATRKHLLLMAAMLAVAAQDASAQAAAARRPPQPVLLGTTGACNNEFPGGPCTQTSTLVQIDPVTGELIREIGPVGYTVNGLAWDPVTGKLYASTAIGCGVDPSPCSFHGLITINPFTGKGTPVNPKAVNFGLAGDPSPIHSVVISPLGDMVAWYDETPAPGVTDTFVRINKHTGVAKEFANTGLDTFQNGIAFQPIGLLSILWNIEGPRKQPDGTFTQNAYVLNPINGDKLLARPITPPTMAALGDFHPTNHLYYGLSFVAFDPLAPTFIVVVDPIKGTATTLGPTVPNLHVLAFVKH